MLPSSIVIPHGMTPAQRYGTCGTRAPTVPSASRRGGYMIQPHALLARRFASKESLLSASRSTTSPAPPGDDGGDQDRSSPWSVFDDELPPNQEARPAIPPAPTPLPPPELAPGPSSLPLPTQPPSDPTLALLMNMMSTFQSEMKSLRSDLSGSVSSMVAEAVAAQLPQVFLILFVQALLNFCHIILLYCSYTLRPCFLRRLVLLYQILGSLFLSGLNAKIGRLCPFSAPRGHTFSTCPPRFPPRVFHGQIFAPDKHKVSAPNAPIQKWSKLFAPEKIEETWKKLTFNILLLH